LNEFNATFVDLNIKKDELIVQILDKFLQNYDDFIENGFEKFQKTWLKHAYNLSKNIKIMQKNDVLEGIFEGITTEGELILANKSNKTYISAGEIFFL
jgi:BirA family biotin operon repressor/biotin-[acetyl-CoA-carboxylase] ligase